MMAMVMCAGEGTRLRPLTYALPKPMMPVANKPVLEHTLENLKRHGIREVVINLSYRPDVIKSYFGDGSRWGMKIHFSIEKRMMGTAGGVKNAERFFRKESGPDFLITSGDGLSDVNFTDFIQFHREKKSFGTIAVKRVDSRFEYGVTITNRKKQIIKFVEKPSWGDVFSNCINTGIYLFRKEIFDSIPKGKVYDFGKQVWPELLKKKKSIYGYEFSEFWTDIGNMNEYRRAGDAVLDQKARIRVPGEEIRPGVWVGKNTKIDPLATLVHPCLIGDDCIIGKNATIGGHTAIGHGSRIASKAVIKNSILWNGVSVGKKAYLDNCIIGTKGKVTENISIFEAAFIDVKDK